MREWLDNLKVGDQVIVDRRNEKSIHIVARLTKTMIVLKDIPIRFRRKNGYSVGEYGWHIPILRKCTPEEAKKVMIENKRRKLINYFKGYSNWDKLSLDQLVQLAAIMKIMEVQE